MIYELRTYTVKQGNLPDVIKAASTVSRDIRRTTRQARRLLVHRHRRSTRSCTRSYTDNEREPARGLARTALGHGTSADPATIRQDIRLLDPVVGPVAPTHAQRLQFRNYRTKPGAVRQWARLMKKVLPAREVFKIVGLWVTEAPQVSGPATSGLSLAICKNIAPRCAPGPSRTRLRRLPEGGGA
jgi:hypothetical protein